MSILNITNGDSARGIMGQAGVAGEIICWRDVLHEGPVPKTKTLTELSSIRASFIAERRWSDLDKVRNVFVERDQALMRFRDHQRLILWFEHDLYDQLQLLQILHWLQAQDRGATEIDLICVNGYLGETTVDGMTSLIDRSSPVSAAQMQLARKAWEAFCSSDPRDWLNLLKIDTSLLPFLKDAVVRHLEQYPHLETGLNRTEKQILEAVTAGNKKPLEIFSFNQHADGIKFMGDSVFWSYMENMFNNDSALLRVEGCTEFTIPHTRPYPEGFVEQEITLTQTGKAVLEGDKDWLSVRSIDKWYGGVKLSTNNIWRWNEREFTLTKTV